ncbi:inorganic diphosphatase [Chondromyces apiculatus]|uniref:inorganic diphosphatase n=1 Tax=Chondromyces apiculatus DSM 436 TaxID=1192034 RepID=A0A017T7K1_9BACT|nr:inorganic diphosphatase [Chondromyces apiculatus]EYF04962.1 Inorganic pyrophosphatase [Chondromyces apiculatus DSM 436]
MDLSRLPPRNAKGHVHVVVESPRGSSVKLKYDAALQAFTLSRPLPLGVTYPFEWGFIPSTSAADGDPLDAMALLEGPSYPGVVLACIPIGVVRVEQDADDGSGRQRNDRVIAVPVTSPRIEGIRDAVDLPERVRAELQQFFLTAVFFQRKNATLLGWAGHTEAEALIDESTRRAANKKSETEDSVAHEGGKKSEGGG